MSRSFLIAALLALAVAGAAGPAAGIAGAQPAPNGGHTAHGTLTSAQQPATVRIADFSFTPQRLTVPVGTEVTWTHAGSAPHTVTATNGAFDSKRLTGGGSFSFTFTAPGTFNYRCEIHPSMTGSITVEAAPAAPATATPAPAPATPATPSGGTPGGEARGAVGTLSFTDGQARSDRVRLEVQGLTPQQGVAITGWLTNADGGAVRLGELRPDSAGKASLTYTDPEGRNLIARYDRVVVTAETGAPGAVPAGTELLRDEIPSGAMLHIRHLLARFETTPSNTALATGLLTQAQLAAERAALAKRAADANDLAGVRIQLEQVVNLIEGERGPNAGDLNGDEKRDNPGDGFGLLNYAAATAEHAQLAIDAAPRDETVRLHGGHVIAAARNASAWLEEARGLALPALRAANVAAARPQIERINDLLGAVLNGRDANRDGRIDPVPGEGGARTAYDHAQLMATLEPTAARAQVQAAPAATTAPSPAAALAAAATAEPLAAPQAASGGDDGGSNWFVIYAIAAVAGLVIVAGSAAWFLTARRG